MSPVMGAASGGSRGTAADGPVRLSRESIVDACIGLADREGIDAVTLRRLGAELGVDPTAVYRHFRDKDELLTAVADRILAGVLGGFRASGEWRRDLREVVLAARRGYLAHPALAHVVATAPDPLPSNTRLAEVVFCALRAAGLDDRTTALAGQVIENYTAGASSLDAAVGTGVDAAWRAGFAMLPPEGFPNAVAVAPYLYLDDEATFAFGLDLILDALAVLAARSARPEGGAR
jgi:TetR/AcrR family transcriptional regulator, tetracycline repressor protein